MSKKVTPSKILQGGQGDRGEDDYSTACEGLGWSTYKIHGHRGPAFRTFPVI